MKARLQPTRFSFSPSVSVITEHDLFSPPNAALFISKPWCSATGCDAGSPVLAPILAVFERGDRNTVQAQPGPECQEYNDTIYYAALSHRWTCLAITFVKRICNRIVMENDENYNYSNLYMIFSL